MLLLPLRFVIDSVLLTQVLPTLLNLSSAVFFYAGAAAFMGHRAKFKRIALAKGIRYHVHDRTLIDGHRAIVFPD